MKTKNRIFSGLSKKRNVLMGMICTLAVLAFPAGAADNGCGDEENDRITPELALCSVHAYNIGAEINPGTQSERQIMNDVVALKTTIMTQQMKKQYDYLEATIGRFKTQLGKAILTAQMEAAGASSENGTSGGGGSSFKSGDKNVVLAGTENCNNKKTSAEVYECLRNNYYVIDNMSNGGQTVSTEVRKQLAADYSVMKRNFPTKKGEFEISPISGKNDKVLSIDCSNFQAISNRDFLQACLQALNTDIRRGAERIEQGNRTSSGMRQMGMGGY